MEPSLERTLRALPTTVACAEMIDSEASSASARSTLLKTDRHTIGRLYDVSVGEASIS
jgi:hypothetical protein